MPKIVYENDQYEIWACGTVYEVYTATDKIMVTTKFDEAMARVGGRIDA